MLNFTFLIKVICLKGGILCGKNKTGKYSDVQVLRQAQCLYMWLSIWEGEEREREGEREKESKRGKKESKREGRQEGRREGRKDGRWEGRQKTKHTF